MSLEQNVHDLIGDNLRGIESLIINLEKKIGDKEHPEKAKQAFSELAKEVKELSDKVARIGNEI